MPLLADLFFRGGGIPRLQLGFDSPNKAAVLLGCLALVFAVAAFPDDFIWRGVLPGLVRTGSDLFARRAGGFLRRAAGRARNVAPSPAEILAAAVAVRRHCLDGSRVLQSREGVCVRK